MDEHKHEWKFAAAIPNPRIHKITNQPLTRLSVLLVCTCGDQRHDWMVEPPVDHTMPAIPGMANA